MKFSAGEKIILAGACFVALAGARDAAPAIEEDGYVGFLSYPGKYTRLYDQKNKQNVARQIAEDVTAKAAKTIGFVREAEAKIEEKIEAAPIEVVEALAEAVEDPSKSVEEMLEEVAEAEHATHVVPEIKRVSRSIKETEREEALDMLYNVFQGCKKAYTLLLMWSGIGLLAGGLYYHKELPLIKAGIEFRVYDLVLPLALGAAVLAVSSFYKGKRNVKRNILAACASAMLIMRIALLGGTQMLISGKYELLSLPFFASVGASLIGLLAIGLVMSDSIHRSHGDMANPELKARRTQCLIAAITIFGILATTFVPLAFPTDGSEVYVSAFHAFAAFALLCAANEHVTLTSGHVKLLGMLDGFFSVSFIMAASACVAFILSFTELFLLPANPSGVNFLISIPRLIIVALSALVIARNTLMGKASEKTKKMLSEFIITLFKVLLVVAVSAIIGSLIYGYYPVSANEKATVPTTSQNTVDDKSTEAATVLTTSQTPPSQNTADDKSKEAAPVPTGNSS